MTKTELYTQSKQISRWISNIDYFYLTKIPLDHTTILSLNHSFHCEFVQLKVSVIFESRRLAVCVVVIMSVPWTVHTTLNKLSRVCSFSLFASYLCHHSLLQHDQCSCHHIQLLYDLGERRHKLQRQLFGTEHCAAWCDTWIQNLETCSISLYMFKRKQ